MKANREDARTVVRTLRDRGFESYLAGGCVRDLILGLEPNDYDVTTAATPAEVQATFPRTVPVGAAFGVVKVVTDGRELDVATFRADGKYSDNRRPDEVTYSRSAQEDVKRRDFTINALLMDHEGNIIDYVAGQEDLKNKILRTVGDPLARFGEDSLRMLRAIRFATRFHLEISRPTWEAIESLRETIKNVSKERVTDELTKTFSYGDCDQSYWKMRKSGLWYSWFGKTRDPGNSFQSMLALAEVEAGEPFILPLALLMFGDYKDNQAYFLGRLVLTNDQKNGLMSLLGRAREVTRFIQRPLHEQRRMMHYTNIDLIQRFISCGSQGNILHYDHSTDQTVFDVLTKMIEVADMGFPDAPVNGNDLQDFGYIPGPIFTKMLTDVQNAQLDGTVFAGAKGVKAFLSMHFPAAPIIVDGKKVDGMGPFRLVACCKKCKQTMSFEIGFNEHGKKIWDSVANPIGVRTYSSHAKYFECGECQTLRDKHSFVKAVI